MGSTGTLPSPVGVVVRLAGGGDDLVQLTRLLTGRDGFPQVFPHVPPQ